jgi:hypothetical protein
VNTDRVYLVILLVLGIVLLSNLVMFAMVRSSRNLKADWFKHFRSSFNRSFKSEDPSLEELHRRVEKMNTREEE